MFAKKKNSDDENLGTTIVLNDNQNENIDLQLFDRYKSIRNELVEINFELNDKKYVLNTIDSFKDIGNEQDSYLIMLIPLLLFLMMLFLILLFELNKKLYSLPYIKKLP